MNQTTSNVLMQPRADATEPLTLIEKLKHEHDDRELTCQDLFEDGHFDDKKTELLIQQTGVMAGLQIAIDIVKQHSEWISADERLPDKDGKYLVYCVGNRELTKDRKELSIMRFNQKTKGGWFALSPLFKVIYWQPIQPPSEVQDAT